MASRDSHVIDLANWLSHAQKKLETARANKILVFWGILTCKIDLSEARDVNI